jgi:hypothetical protein
MLILFDHGTPRGLTRAFSEHTVITAELAALIKATGPLEPRFAEPMLAKPVLSVLPW